jgi:hypothetical protein
MTIEQTVDIPASRRLTIEIPKEVPVGRAQVFIQFPFNEGNSTDIPPEARGQTSKEAFRNALRRAYGAWKENPWTNYVEDINAMRDEWDHRDPWNPDPAKRHRD